MRKYQLGIVVIIVVSFFSYQVFANTNHLEPSNKEQKNSTDRSLSGTHVTPRDLVQDSDVYVVSSRK
ncbi:hypothetical protein [Macrococcus carouselicus]|uniref:Uncharacterized protein n=1 Tax=Macrococcus carouselicus TaxID=69969 RepID=A0A9Q8FSW2_9STAP|nr:hypothetical protein [Macrococcus carouselicus]TDM04684.1 hypothetical protein ERX40_05855 [Macrococcus carouselicus]